MRLIALVVAVSGRWTRRCRIRRIGAISEIIQTVFGECCRPLSFAAGCGDQTAITQGQGGDHMFGVSRRIHPGWTSVSDPFQYRHLSVVNRFPARCHDSSIARGQKRRRILRVVIMLKSTVIVTESLPQRHSTLNDETSNPNQE